MQILINTDRHVDGEADLVQRLEEQIASALSRYAEQVTRVEVHLSDQNADRGGAIDMRCALEARPAGKPPIAVGHSAATTEEACTGAVKKLRNLLDSKYGRIEARRGRESIRHLN